MLSQEMIEGIVFDAMKKFSRENKGAVGWTKDDIAAGVFAAGGNMSDVYRGMALGMDLCQPDGQTGN